jgi:UDP-GlcNAc:undecaprenyl-phosphate GlcNAc-1-phosphate transferase
MRIATYIFIFGSAFLVSLIIMPLAIRLAKKLDIQDHPKGRKNHVKITPLLGGLGIYASFMIVIGNCVAGLFIFANNPYFSKHLGMLSRQLPLLIAVLPKLIAILAGATLLVIVGLLDDKKGLEFSVKVKLVVQLLAALLAVIGGARTSFMPTDWLDALVSVIWIVGICNAFNFLDNMDGLSAGIGVIAAVIFFWVTAAQGQFFSALIFAALAGSILGFLRYNFYPAKIFMGDMGSLFIGYMFGVLALTSSYVVSETPSLIPIVLPIVVLSVPIYDTMTVIAIRIREHRPVYIGDRRHLSHRLVNLGMKPKQAVVFIYLICICIGIAASLLPYVPKTGSITILLQTVLFYILVTILMRVGARNNDHVQL